MFITHVIDDDYPGRCRNMRHAGIINYQTHWLRCLDYENERHVCHFPDPPKQYTSSRISGTITTRLPPKQWVKPSEQKQDDSD